MNKENKISNKSRTIVEFDMAEKEFFKNKPKPKNDEEERMQSEEFVQWYNNVRKQTDTGKTPAEMYKEIYEKESPPSAMEKSRIMNFEWDDDYEEAPELFQKANNFIIEGKGEEALKCINKLITITGEDDEEAILIKAEALNSLGRYEEAEKCIKKIEKKDNVKAYALFYRSQRYFLEGNFAKALEYMKKAYEEEPDNFDFAIGLANYLYINKDEHYKHCIKEAKRIDKKRAEKFLKKYWLEPKEIIKEEFLIAVLACSMKLIEKNEIEEAEKNLNMAALYESNFDLEAVKVIGGLQIECLLMQKRFDEATTKINELIKIDANNPHAYFYKAQLLFEKSKLNEALEEINKCLKIADEDTAIPHPDFYMLKAIILKKQDNGEYLYYENKAKQLIKGEKTLKGAFREFINEG